MKEKSTNLILIIGNGFDLAHGMNTRFTDFANFYIEEVVYRELFNAQKSQSSKILGQEFIKKLCKNVTNFHLDTSGKLSLEKILDNICYNVLSPLPDKREKIIQLFNYRNDVVSSIISNSLLKKLFSNKSDNWFDIEQTYFYELKKLLDKGSGYQKELISLNKSLEDIKQHFKQYLKDEIKLKQNQQVLNSLRQHIDGRETVSFVTFNYTKTLDLYANALTKNNSFLKRSSLDIIHIHGELEGEIVFGYGDDTDEYYHEMKARKEKEYLRNFKTFGYFHSKEYRRLMNRLSILKDYDVLIIGHSLDTTDKTVLNTMLDNDKCGNIELLKRSDIQNESEKREEIFELQANLSRIFNKEVDLRDKLIPYELSINFPFISEEDGILYGNREVVIYKERKQINLSSPSSFNY